MKEYIAEYTDKQGDKQTSYVTAPTYAQQQQLAGTALLKANLDSLSRRKPMWNETDDTCDKLIAKCMR